MTLVCIGKARQGGGDREGASHLRTVAIITIAIIVVSVGALLFTVWGHREKYRKYYAQLESIHAKMCQQDAIDDRVNRLFDPLRNDPRVFSVVFRVQEGSARNHWRRFGFCKEPWARISIWCEVVGRVLLQDGTELPVARVTKRAAWKGRRVEYEILIRRDQNR